MAWTTPVEWLVPAPVGEADFDRIEGNNKYLREENKIINGTTSFSNNITQTAGVTSLKDTTISASDGRHIKLYNPGATVNEKYWTFLTGIDGTFRLRGLLDNEVNSFDALTVTRDASEGLGDISKILINTTTQRGSNRVQIEASDGQAISFYNSLGIADERFFGLVPTTNSQIRMRAYKDDGTSLLDLMAWNRDGNVSIGTNVNNGTDKLQVEGSITATGALTCAGITSTGAINPTTTPTSASWAVTETATTIPRGLYNITHQTGAYVFSVVEAWDGTSWNIFSAGIIVSNTVTNYGCFIASSGSNVRIRLNEVGSATIKYQKY